MLSPTGSTTDTIFVRAESEALQVRQSYLPTLDGWRAVAIFGVLIAHGMTTLFAPGGLLPNVRLMSYAFRGGVGVPVFFAISGFLITYRLILEELARGQVSLRGFYVRRFFRILPASWTYLLVVLLLLQTGIITAPIRAWFGALLMVQNFTYKISLYLGHFWSLSVEEQFYLCWPAVFLLLQRRGTPTRIAVSLALALATLIAGCLDAPFFGFSAIAFGCVLAFVYADVRCHDALYRLMTFPLWMVLVGTVLLGIFGKVPLSDWFLPPVIALVVVGTSIRPLTPVGRALESPALRWVGRCSYSIYLWQDLFCVSNSAHPSRLQNFPLNLICTFALAIPSFYLIEKPFIRVGHKYAKPVTPGRSDLNK